MSSLSRRAFLKATATGAAGMAVLSACGGAATEAPASEAPAADAPAAEAPAADAPAGAAVEVQQWYHEYGEKGCQEAVMRIADEWNKQQSNSKVIVTWTPGDYAAKLNTALAAGTGPDVYESTLNIDRVRNNHVVALDDLFTDEITADFDPTSMKLNTLEGKVWGIQMIIDTGLLWFRKSMLDEAGVAIPTTFEELTEAAATLTSGRVKGIFLGNDGGSIMRDQNGHAAGVDFINENNELLFNTPQLAEAWTKARDFSNSGSLLTGSPTDWWDPSAFVQGLCAMCWGGLWMMPEVQRQIGDDFVVTQWLPVQTASGTPRGSTFWGGWHTFVNGQSKHIPESTEFMNWQWIENTEWQNEWASAYGFHVPPRKSAAAANAKFESGNPKIAKDGLYEYGWSNGPMWNGAMGTAVADAYNNVVKNNADAAAEIQKAYDTCKAELDRQLAG
jgi:multiple sugar transport system substrate-binding protein